MHNFNQIMQLLLHGLKIQKHKAKLGEYFLSGMAVEGILSMKRGC